MSTSSLSSKRSSKAGDLVAPFESQIKDGDVTPTSPDTVVKPAENVIPTSLEQRFKQLHNQPEDVRSLIPQRLRLRTKKSKICMECDEHVIKAEQKTQTTKFKVKHMARYYLSSNN
jgi:uncharacterized protein YlaI